MQGWLVNDAECEHFNLNPIAVRAVAQRLAAVAREAQALGLTIFGGAHSGDLRKADRIGPVIVATISAGSWDGGDGGSGQTQPDGLRRGES